MDEDDPRNKKIDQKVCTFNCLFVSCLFV